MFSWWKGMSDYKTIWYFFREGVDEKRPLRLFQHIFQNIFNVIWSSNLSYVLLMKRYVRLQNYLVFFPWRGGREKTSENDVGINKFKQLIWPTISLIIFEHPLFIWCVVKPFTIFWTSLAGTFWHPEPFAESVLWHCSNDLFLHHFMITYRDVAHTSFGKKRNTP